MVADKDKSEAFQVECLSSRESPMHFALLHFALDLTSLLVMPSTDQHWPVHSSRESPMHFALLNFASLLSGHHLTSRLVMPSTDLISALQQRVTNAFCTTNYCTLSSLWSSLWTSLAFYAIYWSALTSKESPVTIELLLYFASLNFSCFFCTAHQHGSSSTLLYTQKPTYQNRDHPVGQLTMVHLN